MNTALKNVLLTIVIALWLCFIGYSLSCFVAYLIGWPTFVGPIIATIVSLIAILSGLISKKKDGTPKSIFFVIIMAILLSSVANIVIAVAKFSGEKYNGAVLVADDNLYNKWGYKVINVSGTILQEDEVIYIMTKNRVYLINWDGEYIDDAKYEEEIYNYDDYKFVKNPYTHKYHYCKYRVRKKAYTYVDEFREDKKGNRYFECTIGNGKTDIIGLGYRGENCIYHGYFSSNGYTYAFEIQKQRGSDYEIIDALTKSSVIQCKYFLDDIDYKRFKYYDEDEDRWHYVYYE